MNNDDMQSIIDIIKSCDDVQLCTNRIDGYPETRHVTNAMNRNISGLELHFMTGRDSPKFKQIQKNPKCCLYYFNPETRRAVRLFGEIVNIDDNTVRSQHWNDEFKKFGYDSPSDANFILLRITPKSYKFYAGDEMKSGLI